MRASEISDRMLKNLHELMKYHITTEGEFAREYHIPRSTLSNARTAWLKRKGISV